MNPPTDSRWREQALCAETDPEVFFPEPGKSADQARGICGQCPVRLVCLADALAGRDVAFGVRGGLSPVERRALINSAGRRQAA
jgi:WhiB family transcriptional regulator, redox-sensing transcriptional regulator